MAPSPDESQLDPSLYPREYGIATGWKILLLVFGVGLSALGLFLGWKYFADPGAETTVLAIFALLSLAAGLFVTVGTLLSKVILFADAIEIRDLMRVRRLARAEIEGRKLQRTHPGTGIAVVFVPRDPSRKKVKLSLTFQRDETMNRWLETLPDLDREELEASEREILHDVTDGRTPEGRKAALGSARKTARVLNAIAVLSAIAAFVLPTFLPVVATAMALPWIAIAIAARSHGLYTFNDRRNDARAGVGAALTMPGLILCVRGMLAYNLVNWVPAVASSAAVALWMTVLAVRADDRLVVHKATVFVVVLVLTAYGYGTLITANALLDDSVPKTFETTVISKHYTSGKGSHPELKLAPWGPDPGGDVAVSRALYASVSSGSKVCAYLGPGGLGFPWYRVDRCPR